MFAGTVRLVQVLVGYEYFDAAAADVVEFAVALDTEHVQAG